MHDIFDQEFRRLFRWRTFLVLFALALLLDTVSYHPPAGKATVFLLAGIVVGIAAVRPRIGWLLFVLLAFLSDDISKTDPYAPVSDLTTIYTVKIAGVSLSYLLPLLLAGMALAPVLAGRNRIRRSRGDAIAFLALAGYAIALVIGLARSNHVEGWRWFLYDLNPALAALSVYIAFRIFVVNERSLALVLTTLLLGAAARGVLWFFDYVTGHGYAFGQTVRVNFSSGGVALLWVIATFVPLALVYRGLDSRRRVLALLCSFAALFHSVVHAGRLIWILSLVLLITIAREAPRGLRARLVRTSAIVLVLTVGFAFAVRPEAFRTFGWFFKALQFWKAESFASSHSNIVRLAEVGAVWDEVSSHDAWICGLGAGSYWTRRALPSFLLLGANDYDPADIDAGTFHRPHEQLVGQFMKSGALGLLLFALAFLLFHHSTRASYRSDRLSAWGSFSLGLAAYAPTMFLNVWSVQTYLLFGTGLGAMACFLDGTREAKEEDPEAGATPSER